MDDMLKRLQEYEANEKRKKLYTRARQQWKSMLEQKEQGLVEVCTEWMEFKPFFIWYLDNYYEVPNTKMSVAYYILDKWATTYSPETCCIIPKPINDLFQYRKMRQRGYSVGLTVGARGSYEVYIRDLETKKSVYHGASVDMMVAFAIFQQRKTMDILIMTEKYRDFLPSHINEALVNYEIDPAEYLYDAIYVKEGYIDDFDYDAHDVPNVSS